MKRKPDPLIRAQPWRAMAVLSPIESVIKRLENDGTVDAIGKQIVFTEASRGDRYDLPEAMRGVADFHKLARDKYGLPVECEAIEKLANKLDAGSPVFESDIDAVKRNIESCRQQAYQLRVSQAIYLIDAVRIGAELERLKLTEAA